MSVYNEDELSAPKWMNEEFFTGVLRKYENDEDVQITELNVCPASMKGDHFASIMLRVKVSYRFAANGPIMTKSLIVKSLPEEQSAKRDILLQTQIFETEIGMYTTALPKIEQILAQHGDAVTLAPKLIYCQLKPQKVIILEDLCVMGFDTVRARYLTAEEVEKVLLRLAKMHAVSYMLGKSEQHEIVTNYRHGICNSSFFFKTEIIADGIKKFIDMLAADDELREYVPKFRAIEKQLFKACMELYKAYETGVQDEIYVLNHGDFHAKNLMYKFVKKTQLVDFMMVDFQFSVFGPCTIDLLYATYMLLSPELRAQRNALYHQYFEQFIATLKLIKYESELPTFAQLQMSILRHRYYAIFLLSTFLPVMYSMAKMSPEELKDQKSEDLMEDINQLTLFYKNPAYIAEMKKLLPELLLAGFLD